MCSRTPRTHATRSFRSCSSLIALSVPLLVPPSDSPLVLPPASPAVLPPDSPAVSPNCVCQPAEDNARSATAFSSGSSPASTWALTVLVSSRVRPMFDCVPNSNAAWKDSRSCTRPRALLRACGVVPFGFQNGSKVSRSATSGGSNRYLRTGSSPACSTTLETSSSSVISSGPIPSASTERIVNA